MQRHPEAWPASRRLRVALAGAHTEVARVLTETIAERELPVDVTGFTDTDHIDDGLELMGPAMLEGTDLLVLCAPGELAAGLAKGLVAKGKPVLDLSEEMIETAELIWPFLDAKAGSAFGTAAIHAVATGLAGPLVAVLRALESFVPQRVVVDTSESAAVADRAGMDELMAQVRAVYTMQDPKADVFGEQLAFSTIASAGLGDASADDADAALRAVLADETDADVTVCRTLVPTLCVDSAMVHVDVDIEVEADAVLDALRESRGLRVITDGTLTSAAAVDRADALVGRVRVEGQHVSLWLAADRVRCGAATPAALAIEQWTAE